MLKHGGVRISLFVVMRVPFYVYFLSLEHKKTYILYKKKTILTLWCQTSSNGFQGLIGKYLLLNLTKKWKKNCWTIPKTEDLILSEIGRIRKIWKMLSWMRRNFNYIFFSILREICCWLSITCYFVNLIKEKKQRNIFLDKLALTKRILKQINKNKTKN